ncbi:MAG: hypothetical protein QW134_09940 [Nitrososphaeria archaeon]
MTFTYNHLVKYKAITSRIPASLQKGMNYRLHGKQTVILMNLRTNAPYADRVEEKDKTRKTDIIKKEKC